MITMELARGDLMVPALVRAVRAVGVRSGLDLDLLADASIAVEMVARSWSAASPPEPLRVEIDERPGGLDLVFGFADPDSAARISAAGVVAGSRGALEALAGTVEHAASGPASGLRLTFG